MTTKTERKKKPVTAATPWGNAAVVDEAKVAQHVGERRFATVVQLLEGIKGQHALISPDRCLDQLGKGPGH